MLTIMPQGGRRRAVTDDAASLRLRVSCVVARRCVAVGRRASAQVADWPSERPPRPLPARDVKFPPYEIQTLANGLQVDRGARTTSSRPSACG